MDALTAVRETADTTFPTAKLEGLSTALAGFSAMFLGKQDCVFLADAGIQTTCVDIRCELLTEMKKMYPSGWEFVCADIYQYAEEQSVYGHVYDLVCLDPPSGQFQQAADMLPLWCGLADRLVILGTGHDTRFTTPAGWRVTDRTRRSTFAGGVYWTVLEC